MPTYTHGGDVWAYARPMLDFSANLHPLGMPPAVAEAARSAVAMAIHYPDPLCRALRRAIAARDGVSEEQILCGAGAADLIVRLCLALRPKKALITAPTFSEYGQALSLTDCAVSRHLLHPEEGFDLTEAILPEITGDTDLVFLCNPNNPTGRLIDPGLLRSILRRCEETETVLAVDECFLELTSAEGMAPLLERHPSLVLLRAFTKTYAMPGLRLGYLLTANAPLLEAVAAAGQPWSVSTVAQAAGIAACGCTDWPRKGRELLERERPALLKGLRDLGLAVWEGSANYLLFHAQGDMTLKERLEARDILIRSCGNYPGLGPEYYRVAVRTAPDNAILLRALKEALPRDISRDKQ